MKETPVILSCTLVLFTELGNKERTIFAFVCFIIVIAVCGRGLLHSEKV